MIGEQKKNRNKNSVEMSDECLLYTQEVLLKLKEKMEIG